MIKLSSRRKFLGAATTTAAATLALGVPAVRTSAKAAGAGETIVGEGDYRFRANHRWAQLPEKYHWQDTHNVAVDSANNTYVIHEGRPELRDHPAIFAFDSDGKFISAFGCQFQGGGHGIEVRKEGSEEFLYVAAYQGVKSFAKLTLAGDTVWYKKAPMESGLYAPGQDTSTKSSWNRKGFLPTNFAFLDDGGFLLADGYGSYHIHRFDKDAKWVSSFGGAGEGEGKFSVAHGLWVDKRPGRDPAIVVTDRAHHTLQYFTMEGKYIETLTEFDLPANVDTYENLMVVAELTARVSLFDEKNNRVARLDDGYERFKHGKQNLPANPKLWKEGHFMRPHDACFDKEGNVFVAERIPTGRVTKLTRVV